MRRICFKTNTEKFTIIIVRIRPPQGNLRLTVVEAEDLISGRKGRVFVLTNLNNYISETRGCWLVYSTF